MLRAYFWFCTKGPYGIEPRLAIFSCKMKAQIEQLNPFLSLTRC